VDHQKLADEIRDGFDPHTPLNTRWNGKIMTDYEHYDDTKVDCFATLSQN